MSSSSKSARPEHTVAAAHLPPWKKAALKEAADRAGLSASAFMGENAYAAALEVLLTDHGERRGERPETAA